MRAARVPDVKPASWDQMASQPRSDEWKYEPASATRSLVVSRWTPLCSCRSGRSMIGCWTRWSAMTCSGAISPA
ncbi:hypothetical protein DOT98_11030 [Clavibacter michiganensis subsp. michiganensis]|nr:hypothetical protein [Clavibacter michiganensis subsp. michiganensis]